MSSKRLANLNYIDTIVAKLPKSQRRSAKRRLLKAQRLGWTSLGIWTAWKERKGRFVSLPPDENDLFGVPPNSPHCAPIP